MFSGVEHLSEADKASVYANIYLFALVIPVISVCGVVLGNVFSWRRAHQLRRQGFDAAQISSLLSEARKESLSPTVVGMAMPGYMDRRREQIIFAANLPTLNGSNFLADIGHALAARYCSTLILRFYFIASKPDACKSI